LTDTVPSQGLATTELYILVVVCSIFGVAILVGLGYLIFLLKPCCSAKTEPSLSDLRT
jgi:hypothetical protein